jgi:hypothetical protein
MVRTAIHNYTTVFTLNAQLVHLAENCRIVDGSRLLHFFTKACHRLVLYFQLSKAKLAMTRGGVPTHVSRSYQCATGYYLRPTL